MACEEKVLTTDLHGSILKISILARTLVCTK